jgi:hypothetical protein
MTPGLGNVYDAARFDIPTIWLPPANDSQGQQLFMLLEADMVDGHVDWHHLLPGKAIDYSAEQTGVLKKISAAVTRTCGSKTAKKVLERHLAESIESVLRAIDYRLETRRSSAKRPPVHSLTSQLVEKFGAGGAREVARLAAELVLHSENSKKKGGAQ